MPFVSDLGCGPTMYLFSVGMTVGAILLLPTWVDHHYTTKALVADRSLPWRFLHLLQHVLGVLVSLSIVGVALNPWSLRYDVHMIFADGAFFGGLAFAMVVCIIESLRTYRSCAVATLALLLAAALLTCMFHFLDVGVAELGGDLNDVENDMKLIANDFVAYCSAASSKEASSLHSNAYVNLGAFCEWMYLLLMCSILCSKVFFDLHTEPLRARSEAGELHYLTNV